MSAYLIRTAGDVIAEIAVALDPGEEVTVCHELTRQMEWAGARDLSGIQVKWCSPAAICFINGWDQPQAAIYLVRFVATVPLSGPA